MAFSSWLNQYQKVYELAINFMRWLEGRVGQARQDDWISGTGSPIEDLFPLRENKPIFYAQKDTTNIPNIIYLYLQDIN